MGAWSHRIFDDDITLDCLGELSESNNIVEDMQNILSETLECAEEYLDYDACAYGLAVSCMVDAKINGLNMDLLSDGCAEEEITVILEKLPTESAIGMRQMSADVMKAVASEKSELRELWEENEEYYPLVIDIYSKIIKRLEN